MISIFELIEEVKRKYVNDEKVVLEEEKIVYEFVGLIVMSEGGSMEDGFDDLMSML